MADTASLKFDFYQPGKTDLTLPVVVIMNGFGVPAQKNAFYQVEWAKVIAGAGLKVVTFESHAADVAGDYKALIDHLRFNAARYKIDPRKIITMMFSGNVSNGLPIVTDPADTHTAAIVIYYGMGEVKRFRPDQPVFFVRSGLDNPTFNRRIDTLISKAISQNAPWTIINHHSGRHPFEFGAPDALSIEVIKQTLAFMHRSVSDTVQKSLQANKEEVIAGTALATADWPTAIAGYEKMVARQPSSADLRLTLGNAYFGAGAYAKALVQYDSSLALGLQRMRDLSIPAALAAARLKDAERTLKWLGILSKAPRGKETIRAYGDFSFLHQDPRYQELIQ